MEKEGNYSNQLEQLIAWMENIGDDEEGADYFYNAQSWTRQLTEMGIETNGKEITNLDDLYFKY